MNINFKEIELREFILSEKEWDIYVSWLRDLNNIRTIGRYEYLLPMDIDEIHKYVKKLQKSNDDAFFSVYYVGENKNKFIGTFKIGHIDWRSGIGDLGIMIGDNDYKGKGLATDIARAGCRYAFEELGLRRITAGSYETNIAMCKCLKHLGFVKEGTLRGHIFSGGKYINHCLFGLLKEEFEDKQEAYFHE